MIAVVDMGKCAKRACSECPAVKSCDVRAIIRIDSDEPVIIDQTICHGCADCLAACEHGTISLVDA